MALLMSGRVCLDLSALLLITVPTSNNSALWFYSSCVPSFRFYDHILFFFFQVHLLFILFLQFNGFLLLQFRSFSFLNLPYNSLTLPSPLLFKTCIIIIPNSPALPIAFFFEYLDYFIFLFYFHYSTLLGDLFPYYFP